MFRELFWCFESKEEATITLNCTSDDKNVVVAYTSTVNDTYNDTILTILKCGNSYNLIK